MGSSIALHVHTTVRTRWPRRPRGRIVAARTERQTYRQISQTLNVGHSSVARVLVRAGLNRLVCLEPAAPIQRYEYDAPGGMLHLDTKKLGRFNRPGHRVTADRTLNSRGAGWEYVHVAIDDHSRLAMASRASGRVGGQRLRGAVAGGALLPQLGHLASPAC